MKKLYLLLMFLAFATATMGQTTSKKTLDNFARLAWLEGTWTNLKAKPGQTGHERWLKSTATELRGYGVTMKGTDTLFVEKLKILIKDDNLYYVADVAENHKPVLFKLTNITATSFVCENPEHDFPKKIEYTLDQGQLKARISGDGKAMDFLFRKK